MIQVVNILTGVLNQVYIQFILQLMISESIFLLHRPAKRHSLPTKILSLLILFGTGYLWTRFVAWFADAQSLLYAVLYLGFAGLTYLWIMFHFDINPLEIFFAVSGGYAVEHMAFTVTKILTYCLTQFTQFDRESILYLLITRFAVYVVTAFLVYKLIVQKNNSRLEFRESDKRVVCLSLMLMFSAVIMSQYYNREQYSGSVLTEIICPMYGLFCCLLVLIMVYYILWTKEMQWEHEMMDQLSGMAEVQKKSTKEAIDIINIKCHDLKHQIAALEKIDNKKERQTYIEEIRNAISIYDAVYHTGSEALDYVLREKTLIAEEHGIRFSTMADGRLLSFMNTADIYAFMGNAIDNAFESVLKEPPEKRIVSLQIRKQGKMTMFHIENWTAGEPEFRNGLPLTDKKDKDRHGFGVKSIRYIVKKYDGELCIRVRDNKFHMYATFPCEDRS